MKKLLILFLVISTNLITAQESVLLRLNYEKGSNYDVSMKMSQDMGSLMSTEVSINMRLKVLDVKEDTYTSEMKFTKMTMDMLRGDKVVHFDSSKKDEELDENAKMMKTQIGPMLEAVVSIKGNNLGEILKVTVVPNVPGMDDITNKSNNVVYPKEAVKVGSTWNTSKDQKGMKMDFTYKVKSITKDKIVLDVSGDVSGIANGKIIGNLDIERKSGITLNSSIGMNLSMNGQKLKSKITLTTVKK